MPMVIHCDNDVWCSECDDRCEEYTENQKKFFEIIIEKQKQQIEEKIEMKKQDTMEIHITPGMIPTTEEDDELTKMGELQNTINEINTGIAELEENEDLQKLLTNLEKTTKKLEKKIQKWKDDNGITQLEKERNDIIPTDPDESTSPYPYRSYTNTISATLRLRGTWGRRRF